MMGKGRTPLSIGQNIYDRAPLRESDIWDNREHQGRSIHIVRIVNNLGDEVDCARIYGTQDECDVMAEEWTNGLLRANPGMFLKWTISDIAHDSVIRSNTERREQRILTWSKWVNSENN